MFRRLLVITVLLAVTAGCSLSAPPPDRGNAPLLSPPPAMSEGATSGGASFELPMRRPSVEAGAAIFAEKCVDCHGATGRGDGPRAAMVRDQTGSPPPDLTDPNITGASTAEDWFNLISNGRLDKLMPPFSGSLDASQRWDVIAYVWSLGSSATTLDAGRALYVDRCAACHGETGRGDGPQAGKPLLDFTQIETYRSVAPGEWASGLATAHVPSFAGKFTTNEEQAVIAYVRSLTYDRPGVAVAAVTPTPEPQATPTLSGPVTASVTITSTTPVSATPPLSPTTAVATSVAITSTTPISPASAISATTPAPTGTTTASGGFVIAGTLTNGTAGGSLPADLPIEVTVTHSDGTSSTHSARSDSAGKFTLAIANTRAGDILTGTVSYGEMRYFSQPITVTAAMANAAMPVTVYETTPDVSVLHVETLHVIVVPVEDKVQVDEIYVISNRSDRVVANTSGPAFQIALPPGATNVKVMNDFPPDVVLINPDGIAFFEAVFPGSASLQLIVNYELAATGGSVSLSRAALIPIDAVSLLLGQTDTAYNLTSSMFTPQGGRQVNGVVFEQYAGGGLTPGQTLTVQIAHPVASDPKLIAGIVLLCVGMAITGFGLWRRRGRMGAKSPQPPKSMSVDDLIARIAALDDQFAAGEIETEAYQRVRKKLKDQLVQRMNAT